MYKLRENTSIFWKKSLFNDFTCNFAVFLEELLEEMISCPQNQIPEVAASWIIADIVTVMVVVVGGSHYERQDSHWTPRELVTRVSLCAQGHFEDNPEEIGEAMDSTSQDHQSHRSRQLHTP